MSELTDRIRAKFPGAYDGIDDAALEKAVLAKYPQYQSLAGGVPPAPAEAPAPPPAAAEFLARAEEPDLIDKGVNAAKGFFDSAVLQPVSDAMRDAPDVVQDAFALTPPGLVGAAAGAVGSQLDSPGVESAAIGAREGGREGMPAALEQVAPVDIVTVGAGGLAARTGKTALRATAGAADLAEALYGGTQVATGAAEGDLGKVGVGVARLAGGTAGAADLANVGRGVARAKNAADTPDPAPQDVPEPIIEDPTSGVIRSDPDVQAKDIEDLVSEFEGQRVLDEETRLAGEELGTGPDVRPEDIPEVDRSLEKMGDNVSDLEAIVQSEGAPGPKADEPTSTPEPEPDTAIPDKADQGHYGVHPKWGRVRVNVIDNKGRLHVTDAQGRPHIVDATKIAWEPRRPGDSFGRDPQGPKPVKQQEFDEKHSAVTENASGESAASGEAISRQSGMKARGEEFVVYDRAGNRRPLVGPEAVDYVAKDGETFGVEGPEGFRTLQNRGGKTPDDVPEVDRSVIKMGDSPADLEAMHRAKPDATIDADAEPELDDLLLDMGIDVSPKAEAPPATAEAAPGGKIEKKSFKPKGKKGKKGGRKEPRLPKINKIAEDLPEPVRDKLRSAVSRQLIGRESADASNAALHYQQALITRKWQDAAMAGEIPSTEVNVRARRELSGKIAKHEKLRSANLSPEESEMVAKAINSSPVTRDVWEKFHAAEALEGLQSGTQLQPAQLDALRKLLGPTVVPVTPQEWGWFEKLKRSALMLSGTLKSLRASFDLSGFRQSAQLAVAHPDAAADAFVTSLRSLVNEGHYKSFDDALQNLPLRDLMDASGLHLSKLSDPAFASLDEAPVEEVFAHGFGQRIPGVRHSERAYVTLLNKMRADVFSKHALELMRSGARPKNDMDPFRRLAKAVNLMSGRGTLGTQGEKASTLLNAIFFAPRFTASRFQSLAMLPRIYKYPKPVRSMILRGVIGHILATAAALKLVETAGVAAVDWDLRSSDGLKAKVGPVTYDPWVGYAPIARLITRLATQSTDDRDLGSGISSDGFDEFIRFMEFKGSPGTGIAIQAMRGGEDALGRDMGPVETVLNHVLPFFFSDVKEVWDAGEQEQLLFTVPFSALGGGVQSREPRGRDKNQGVLL